MKLLRVFYFLSIAFLFAGCGSEDEQEVTSSTTTNANMSDYSIIHGLGLDTTSIVDKGDYYLVEGDIALNKQSLKGYVSISGQSKLRQGVVTGRLVSQSKVGNITVRIDNGIPISGSGGEWRNAVSSAIQAWNSVPNCLVNFSLTTAPSADITVKIGHDDSSSNIAWTFLPSGSNPPSELYINDLIFDTFLYKTNTITHELGHTIGLLHAHVSPTSQDNNGVTIPGTPDTDYESIMSYFRDRTLSPGFSYYDVIAVQYLYPKSELNIVPSTTNANDSEIVTYTISNYTGSATWQAIQNATLISGQGSNTATFRVSGNGYAAVGAEYYFSGNYFSLNNKSVWIGLPSDPILTSSIGLNLMPNSTSTVTALSDGATSYKWRILGDAFFTNYPTSLEVTTDESYIDITTNSGDEAMSSIIKLRCTPYNYFGNGTTKTLIMNIPGTYNVRVY